MDDTLPLRSRALQFLRELRGWTQQELADAAGVSKLMIGYWEQGVRVPSPEKFRDLARVLGHTEATVREVLRLLSPPVVPQARWIGPVFFTVEQEREMADFGDESGRLVAFSLTQGVRHGLIQDAVDRERRTAQALRASLVAERSLKAAVRRKPEYQTWAVAELLCEESIRSASHNPQRALELAEAAVGVAELIPGEEKWRLRVQGYALAHLGNAWRVMEKWELAREAFIKCSQLWNAGQAGDTAILLNEGRVFGLEASLLREQGLLPRALELLHEGLAKSNEAERPYLLINKAKTLEAAEDFVGAIDSLRAAVPLVDRQSRLRFVLHFDLAVNLCNLRQFEEVAQLLPMLRSKAHQLRNDLERVRVSWLEGRVAIGLGSIEEGVEILSTVKDQFIERQLAYDAGLVSLDLADGLLQLKRFTHLRTLIRQLMTIFTHQCLPEKALAVLLLFKKAVEEESATVELVRSLRTSLRRTRGKSAL